MAFGRRECFDSSFSLTLLASLADYSPDSFDGGVVTLLLVVVVVDAERLSEDFPCLDII
jgi:hypothetical protein